MIIGQDKILSQINTFTIDSLPSAIMIIGENGSGKHTIVNYIAERFKLIIEDITPQSSNKDDGTHLEFDEKINKMYEVTEPHLYLVDGDLLASRGRGEMNALLKVLEDPIYGSYIVFLCETTANILDTICNRCYQIQLERYTSETLKQFLGDGADSRITEIVNTPGQVIAMTGYNIEDMVQYASKVIGSIKNANYANILNISRKKISYDGDKDKYMPTHFILVLMYVLKQQYFTTEDNRLMSAYLLTNKLYNNSKIANIDMKNLFEHYLFELKKTLA